MKKATTAVMLISLAVCIAAAGVLGWRALDSERSAGAFASIRDQLSSALSAKAEEAPPADNPQLTALPETDDPVVQSYRDLALEHPDMVGWLRIDGTVIDYPVMRSPEEAERYLHRDFDGRYSRAGTPFMLPISDPSVPNENIIIYAHHMKDKSMFGSLPVYETLEGFEAHPTIQFDTLYGQGTYQVIAAFRTSIGAENEFPYYRYEWLDDEETFDRYLRGVMANRLYDTGETAVYGDQLLSLSTCDYHEENGRFVVVAKRIMETEVQGDA